MNKTVWIPCPDCEGEGFIVRFAGLYRGWNNVIERLEEEEVCEECGGEGAIEIEEWRIAG